MSGPNAGGLHFHFHRFNVYVQNFQSYVPLHLYVCWCLVCVCQVSNL